MFLRSSVVDASYVHRKYQQLGIIGKGKDYTLDITSSIYLLKERKKIVGLLDDEENPNEKKFALQVYHNLSPDFYRKKVQQLQMAMTEHVTNYATRIILLANRKINKGSYDLHVVYDVDDLLDKTLENEINDRKAQEDAKQIFSEEEAKKLLEFFVKNILVAGRYTFEFLDISPYNVFLNTKKLENYDDYVISNFALSFHGTKFFRRYQCLSDPFHNEPIGQKSVP